MRKVEEESLITFAIPTTTIVGYHTYSNTFLSFFDSINKAKNKQYHNSASTHRLRSLFIFHFSCARIWRLKVRTQLVIIIYSSSDLFQLKTAVILSFCLLNSLIYILYRRSFHISTIKVNFILCNSLSLYIYMWYVINFCFLNPDTLHL